MSNDATLSQLWILRHGSNEAPPSRIALRAGPLSMVFEDGDLRYIRLGGREIIRRVYAMVRDGSWNTYPGKILRIDSHVLDDSFAISFESEHAGDIENGGKVRFKNLVKITGSADGSLRYSMQGTSHQRFLSNRIGICVLHPTPEVIGTPVTIEHIDGSLEKGTFPADISPTLPFTDIRALITETIPRQRLELRFTGAVFEMEDQRNYGDSSFKTFGTPLRMPKPVDIVVGAKVEQEVTLRLLDGKRSSVIASAATGVTVGHPTSTRIAPLGFGIRELDGIDDSRSLITALKPAHLHVELLLVKSGWQQLLGTAGDLAFALGCPLEVCLFAPEQLFSDTLVHEVATVVRSRQLPVCSWLVYTPKGFPSPAMISRARRLLSNVVSGAKIGGGSWTGYCLMNENRPDFSTLDIVAFENNPQGHAADNSTVMENIWAMGEAVASAKALAGNAAVAVAPLRMMPRDGEAANNPRRVADQRQATLFGAAWTCGALSRILLEGPQSISCFELLGDNGMLRRSATGAVRAFPLYHVFADIAEFAEGIIISTTVDQPLNIAALSLSMGRRQRTLIANLRSQSTMVSIDGINGPLAVRILDERSAEEAATMPRQWREKFQTMSAIGGRLDLELLPYATTSIDSLNP